MISTYLCLQVQLANSLAILSWLFRGSRRYQLDLVECVSYAQLSSRNIYFHCIDWQSHVFYSKVIQGFGNFDLLCCVEEGRCKLFALAQCAVYDFEIGKATRSGYLRCFGDSALVAFFTFGQRVVCNFQVGNVARGAH